jgi:hypothetical protein
MARSCSRFPSTSCYRPVQAQSDKGLCRVAHPVQGPYSLTSQLPKPHKKSEKIRKGRPSFRPRFCKCVGSRLWSRPITTLEPLGSKECGIHRNE